MSLTVLQLQGTQLTRVPTVAIVQSLSHVWLFATPWTAAHQAAPSSLSPGLCSNSSPLSQWCYLTILSSATPFSLCLWSFTLSGSFPVSQLFPSGGWSIGASASPSILPMNIQGWFPLGLTGLISLQSKGLSRIFSNITAQKHHFFSAQPSVKSNSHICIWLWKNHIFDFTDLCWQSYVPAFQYTV